MVEYMTMTDYESFIKINLGKPVEREDPSNPDQCFDWAFAYLDDVLGVPRSAIRHLHAYEIWTKATDETRKYFDLIPNSPTNVPPKGAIVVFGTEVGPSGHVCIASGNTDGTKAFQSTDENWNGHKYIEYVWHTYGGKNGVLGWLVKKNASTGTTEPMVTIPQKELDTIRLDRDKNYNDLQAALKQIEILKKRPESCPPVRSYETEKNQIKEILNKIS